MLEPTWAILHLLERALLALLVVLLVYGFHPIAWYRFRRFPGPRGWWLVGNLPTILREGSEAACARWAQQYGPGAWVFWLGGVPVVMADSPELARKILTRPRRHKIFSLHVGEQEAWDSANMVFVNGEKWKVSRNAWQPFFSHASISRNGKLMADSADKLCRQLGAASDEGRELDIWRAAGRLTLDVVGTTAFGVDFNTLDRGQDEGGSRRLRATASERLVWALTTFFELFGLGNAYFALFFLFPELEPLIKWLANALPNAAFKQELEARRELKQVGTELAQQAREGQQARSGGAPAGGSFLDLMLPSVGRRVGAETLDDGWVSSQAATFILAGYETTANAIGFTIYLLSSNPGCEARLLAELDAFGRGRVPTLEELDAGALPFAQAALQESLRMYPPGSTAAREAGGGMVLGGLPVPDKAAVQVSIFSMHRNPRYWRDPLAFKPERFMAGTPEAAEVVPGAYLPFGDGSRKCIGLKFALLETTLTLVKLYQQFTFRLLPGQTPLQVRTILTLGPAHGIRVTVHRR